jgi:hypothetical protein
MKWLEIPAHRVLEIERQELTNEFEAMTKAARTIPTQIGHLFRSKPARVTEQIGHPLGIG